MLDRLLNNIHPAINKDPQASPAIRISGIGTVIIKEDIAQIIGSTSSIQINLQGYTLDSFATAINNISGMSAVCIGHPTLSALVLIPGTYTASTTINLFNSLLWQILKPVALALLAAFDANDQAVQEMIINSADGGWLDAFGDLFGVSRETGEPDSMYSTRIFNLSVGYRVNNMAIKKALYDVGYGADVQDAGTPKFTVKITIPTNSPSGFIYTTQQIKDIIDLIRPSGVPYDILSEGSTSDTAGLADSYTAIKASTPIKYGTRKWGQMIWG